MPLLYNTYRGRQIRRALRNNATPSERLLWHYLRKRQLLGLKFRRQYGIRRFIVDFYCPEVRLAIEIDGDTHFVSESIRKRDRNRQHRLEALGVHILRFLSSDVLNNTDEVVNIIEKRALELKNHGVRRT